MLVVRVAVVMTIATFFGIHRTLYLQDDRLYGTVGGHGNSFLKGTYPVGIILHFDAAFLTWSDRLLRPFGNSATAAAFGVRNDERLGACIGENEGCAAIRILHYGTVIVNFLFKLDLRASLLRDRHCGNDDAKGKE